MMSDEELIFMDAIDICNIYLYLFGNSIRGCGNVEMCRKGFIS